MRWTICLATAVLVALGGCQNPGFWQLKRGVPVTEASEVYDPPLPRHEETPAAPAEPAPPEAAPSEAGPVEVAQAEPVPTEVPQASPAPTEVARPRPDRTEPLPVESAPVEPLPVRPAPPQPAATEPAPLPTRPAPPPVRESPAPIPLDELSTRRPAATTVPDGAPRGSEVVSEATIRVNNRVFTVDDIVQASALELGTIPAGLSDSAFSSRAEKIITDEIRQQVGQTLALDEANRALGDEQKKMIDREMDATLAAMISQADGSRRKLEADLINQGTALEAVLADHRRELTIRWFLRWKFAPMVSVTRAMLWDYYRAHGEEFAAPKKVQMQIVSVPFSAFVAPGSAEPSEDERAAARAAARERIDQAVQALAAGDDIASVARRFSLGPKAVEGGLWPLMPAGSFRQEQVEKVAFAQAVGQVSDVIETDEGLYIVKTAAVEQSSRRSFEDAQADIEKILRDQQSAKLYNEYYAKLLSEATIVQSDRFVPTAVSRALDRYHAR